MLHHTAAECRDCFEINNHLGWHQDPQTDEEAIMFYEQLIRGKTFAELAEMAKLTR